MEMLSFVLIHPDDFSYLWATTRAYGVGTNVALDGLEIATMGGVNYRLCSKVKAVFPELGHTEDIDERIKKSLPDHQLSRLERFEVQPA